MPLPSIEDRQMDATGSGSVAQDAQPVSLPGLKQPVKPSPAIFPELQQKIPFMPAMGEMPGISRNAAALCSSHGRSSPQYGKPIDFLSGDAPRGSSLIYHTLCDISFCARVDSTMNHKALIDVG
jgi:hypothetical protein